jgi:hypothetical protein
VSRSVPECRCISSVKYVEKEVKARIFEVHVLEGWYCFPFLRKDFGFWIVWNDGGGALRGLCSFVSVKVKAVERKMIREGSDQTALSEVGPKILLIEESLTDV